MLGIVVGLSSPRFCISVRFALADERGIIRNIFLAQNTFARIYGKDPSNSASFCGRLIKVRKET